MANLLYPLTKEKLLLGTIANGWESGDIRATLVRTSGGGGGPYYTYAATDDFLSDIPSNSDCRPETAVALTESSPNNDGTADVADFTFPAATAGDAIQVVVLYDHTGVEGTSELWAYYDTSTGLPVTPNGADINFNVNVSGVFTI